MAEIFIRPIASEVGNREWILFERGQYQRPLCILSDYEVDRLIRDVAKVREQDADVPGTATRGGAGR